MTDRNEKARQRCKGRRPQHQGSSGWSSGQHGGDIPRPGPLEGGPTGQRAHSYARRDRKRRNGGGYEEPTENYGQIVFLAPAMVGDATSLTAGGSRTRTRSDDEESATPLMSCTSLVSTVTKGKKRKLVSLTPDVSEERSSQWGDTRTNTRGRMLSDWAAGLRLLLTNRGSTSTCVAWSGSSVVDVTWTTASLHRRIRIWRVAEGVETLSNHLYIMMELTSETASIGQDRSNTRGPSRSRPPPTPRWRLKERDRDLLLPYPRTG
jgi:hypothetical protein